MEKLDSVIVTLVLKMKEIVILMMSVKMVLFVDQTIAQGPSVLTQKLIVVVPQVKLENCENAWAIAFIEHDYCSGHRKWAIKPSDGFQGGFTIRKTPWKDLEATKLVSKLKPKDQS